MNYTLFDYWDDSHKNPIPFSHEGSLIVGTTFDVNDVTYRVMERFRGPAIGEVAVVKMVRYKIADTATQFVHKCPAKKKAWDKFTAEDIVKLEEQRGRKVTDQMQMQRVKMRALQTEIACSYCGTVFWKEVQALPETVDVERIMNKTKKKTTKKVSKKKNGKKI